MEYTLCLQFPRSLDYRVVDQIDTQLRRWLVGGNTLSMTVSGGENGKYYFLISADAPVRTFREVVRPILEGAGCLDKVTAAYEHPYKDEGYTVIWPQGYSDEFRLWDEGEEE